MDVAVCVGEVVRKVLGAGWAVVIPDVVDEALSRFDGTVFARDRIAIDR